MSADCLPAKLRETLIKTIFDSVRMGDLMAQDGAEEEDADLICAFLREAENELQDWSSNL
jgi:hypothetical protein